MSAEGKTSGVFFTLLLSVDFKYVNNFKKILKMYFKCDFAHFTQPTSASYQQIYI
jgi:hypothetical protein